MIIQYITFLKFDSLDRVQQSILLIIYHIMKRVVLTVVPKSTGLIGHKTERTNLPFFHVPQRCQKNLKEPKIIVFDLLNGLRRGDYITPYYVRLKVFKLADLRWIQIVLLLYSFLESGLPEYSNANVEVLSQLSSRDTYFRSSLMRIPHHTTVIFNKYFTATSCRLWNSLPSQLKPSKSVLGLHRHQSVYT